MQPTVLRMTIISAAQSLTPHQVPLPYLALLFLLLICCLPYTSISIYDVCKLVQLFCFLFYFVFTLLSTKVLRFSPSASMVFVQLFFLSGQEMFSKLPNHPESSIHFYSFQAGSKPCVLSHCVPPGEQPVVRPFTLYDTILHSDFFFHSSSKNFA